MKLTDLDPRWLMRDGRRIGFVFKSPANPHWWQSCFVAPTPHEQQRDAFNAALADQVEQPEHAWTKAQGCRQECAWTVAGGIDAATFETMTVRPSLDGSAGGLWHGHITNGAIK
jgi:hypothetical protein